MSDKQATAIDCTKPGVTALVDEYMNLLKQENTLTPERDHARSVWDGYDKRIKSLNDQRSNITNAVAMLHGENIAWTGYESARGRYETLIEQASAQMTAKDQEDAGSD